LSSRIVLALAEPIADLTRLPSGLTLGQTLSQSGVPASYASRSLLRVASKRAARPMSTTHAAPPGVVAPTPLLPGTPARASAAPSPAAAAMGAESRRRISDLFGDDAVLDTRLPPPRAIAVNPIAIEPAKSAALALFAALPNRKANVRLGGLAAIEYENLDTIMRSPVVSDPLVELLRVFDSRAVLRGADALPNNTVLVLKENRAFTESFLLGANHEMNNELRWREFPTDMRGTVFRRFWDRKRAPDDPAGDDIPEIHRWTQALGANYPPHDADRAEALVLLIRGDLVRKYGMILAVLNHAPATTFAVGQGVDHSPIFAGRLGTDVCYFGFDIPRETVTSDKARYFFVLFEAPGQVRFGLDVATAAVRRDRFAFTKAALSFPVAAMGRSATQPLLPPHLRTGKAANAQPNGWDELSWSHMRVDSAGYVDALASAPAVSATPEYWSAGRDSASIARSFWQKPIAVVVPAARLLP
jgi:hypothetical protein